jgi:hypothetical protein
MVSNNGFQGENMHKLSIAFVAAIAALAINGTAYSADSDDSTQSSQDSTPHKKAESVTVTEPIEPPADSTSKAVSGTGNKAEDTKSNDAYLAKLKRCEGLSTPGERKECADRTKKAQGQM